MIDTSELRIGNIILFYGEPIVVKGIHKDSVLLDGVMRPDAHEMGAEYDSVPASEDCLQPLPLSDFLLESMKLGRIVSDYGVQHPYHFRSSTFTICSNVEGYFIGMCIGGSPIHITPNHFYCYHQLQNIYFTQYGEEFGVSEQDVRIAWRTAKALNIV